MSAGDSGNPRRTGNRRFRIGPGLLITAAFIGPGTVVTASKAGAERGCGLLWTIIFACWGTVIVTCTCAMVLVGRYRVLHSVLVALVALLSVSFLCTALFSLPSASLIVRGLLVPQFDSDDLTLVLALVGTTIVPYNLFLHASSAASTWKGEPTSESIVQSDWDTTLSVCLGGLITASILITASTSFFDTQTPWTSTDDISRQLEPTLGGASAIAFAIGLFAAGLTSSITAPLATAYAVCGCLGWSADPAGRLFRIIALSVVAIGGAIALVFGKSPSATIVFAQLTNGLLLPIVAVFLLMVVTRKTNGETKLLGGFRLQLARLVVGAVALLGLWRIVTLFA